jgi:hypothetical protein
VARRGFDVYDNKRKFDAVLLDIDHSPEHFLRNKKQTYTARKDSNRFGNNKENGVSPSGQMTRRMTNLQTFRIFLLRRQREQSNLQSLHESVSVNSVYVARKSKSEFERIIRN